MAIRLLQENGIEIAWISGGFASSIQNRAKDLDIKYCFTSIKEKDKVLRDTQAQLNISTKDTIFLGDDINDLLVIPAVNMFLSPANAHPACIKNSEWVGTMKGGEGFIREFTDLFLLALNINPFLPFKTCND